MADPSYDSRVIPGVDLMETRTGPRYEVLRVSDGERVATHEWAQQAKDDARARSIAEGACAVCGGEGTVITDYMSTPDGDSPIGTTCECCGGTGIEPGA